MPERKYSATSGYRYGFNGKENDDEVKGEANSLDFGARTYDPRIGRWFAIDPLRQIYTSLSPYNFGANNPINILDADGNILKDKNGNIIATENGTTSERVLVSTKDKTTSIVVKYKNVTIYTDKGNPVQAKIATGFVERTTANDGTVTEKNISSVLIPTNSGNIKVTSESVKSNCHGYAFAENNLFIGDGNKNILSDEYEYLGVTNNTSSNSELESKADIVVIYGYAGEFKEMKSMREDFWYHTGTKQSDGKFTDKDDFAPIRRDLGSAAEVKSSPLEMQPWEDKDRVLFKRKEAASPTINSLAPLEKQPTGIRIVSQEELNSVLKEVRN